MDTVEYQPQTTTRIDQDELQRLLDTMTPVPQQRVTAQMAIPDIAGALAAGLAEPVVAEPVVAEPVVAAAPVHVIEAVSAPVLVTEPIAIAELIADAAPSRRKYPRPFSHVAALLPPAEPTRRPSRATLTMSRPLAPVRSLAVPGSDRARTISEICACVETEEAAPAVPVAAEVVQAAPRALEAAAIATQLPADRSLAPVLVVLALVVMLIALAIGAR